MESKRACNGVCFPLWNVHKQPVRGLREKGDDLSCGVSISASEEMRDENEPAHGLAPGAPQKTEMRRCAIFCKKYV